MNPFSPAANNGHYEAVKFFVKLVPDTTTEEDIYGLKLLSKASADGQTNIVDLIVQKQGPSLLIKAAKDINCHAVKFFVRLGVLGYIYEFGSSLAFKAAIDGDLELFTLLGENSVNVYGQPVPRYLAPYLIHETNGNGDTQLTLAAAGGHLEVVHYLLHKGADLHKTNHDGDTALSLAASGGHLHLVEYLIENGARIHDKNKQSRPLFNASSNGENKVVEYLLKKRANPSTRGCLSISLELYHQDVFETLLNSGANVTMVSVH